MKARGGTPGRALRRRDQGAPGRADLPPDGIRRGGLQDDGVLPAGPRRTPRSAEAARVRARRIEAARQRALLGALFGSPDGGREAAALAAADCAESGDRVLRGLAAYRGNAAALAERTLGAAHPTLAALVGPEGLAALARGLWRAAPPRRGDLAHWGTELPDFIEARRELAAWPWLADCARLDAAVQRCEAAADALLDPASLALLAGHAPASLRLRLRPDVQLLRSDWPVAALRAAHEDVDGEEATRRVHEALASGRAESVAVARGDGWRAGVTVLEAPCFAWMQALCEGRTLDEALRRAGDGFEFEAWLRDALGHGWLHRAELVPAPDEGEPP